MVLNREAALDEQRGFVSLPKRNDPTAYSCVPFFVSLADTPGWLWYLSLPYLIISQRMRSGANDFCINRKFFLKQCSNSTLVRLSLAGTYWYAGTFVPG